MNISPDSPLSSSDDDERYITNESGSSQNVDEGIQNER
jgi:hypothetical protein